MKTEVDIRSLRRRLVSIRSVGQLESDEGSTPVIILDTRRNDLATLPRRFAGRPVVVTSTVLTIGTSIILDLDVSGCRFALALDTRKHLGTLRAMVENGTVAVVPRFDGSLPSPSIVLAFNRETLADAVARATSTTPAQGEAAR